MTVQHRLTASDLLTTMPIKLHNSYYRAGITHLCSNTPRDHNNMHPRWEI